MNELRADYYPFKPTLTTDEEAKLGSNRLKDAGPLASPRLPNSRAVPGRIGASEHPPPVGCGRDEDPEWKAERAG